MTPAPEPTPRPPTADRALVVALVVLTAGVLALRIGTLPRRLEHVDGLHFARGVERYSIMERRPFWPGYPIYIGIGKLFFLGTGDAPRALHLISAVASSLSLWPVGLLAADWRRSSGGSLAERRAAALVAAGLWIVSPLSWLVGSEALSDPTGLGLALVMLWCCHRSFAAPRPARWLVAAAVLAGLTLGARLAYVTLLFPLGYALWDRRHRAAVPVWPAAVAFAATVGSWLAWQWLREGPLLLQMAAIQLRGHHQSWGGGLGLDPAPLLRPARLAATVAADGFGMGGLPWPRLVASAGTGFLVVVGVRRLASAVPRGATLAALWLVPYATGLLAIHDVSYPRYALPLVALLCVVAGVGLPRPAAAAALVSLGTIAAVAAVSVPLALAHRETPRMGYRVVRWVQDRLDPRRTAILLTPESEAGQVTDLTFYFDQGAPAYWLDRVSAGQVGERTRTLEAEGRTVFATAPARDSPGEWAPVARFCRSGFIETPGPEEIWLFRHGPRERDAPAATSAWVDAPTLDCS